MSLAKVGQTQAHGHFQQHIHEHVILQLSFYKMKKTKIYEIMYNFLNTNDYLEETGDDYTLTGDSFASQQSDGIYFISKVLFPAIAGYIGKENARTTPNTKKIAVLNKASRLISYDYYIVRK